MSAGDTYEALTLLGFTDRWRALFAPHADEGLVPGRVIRADRGSVLVATEDDVVRAETAVRLVKESASSDELPAAGDWVALDVDPSLEVPLVEAVLPRSSAFVRGDSGKAAIRQVLAANVDTVFVVHPVAEANLRRIERELALAWESGATPVVVLTKSDLAEDADAVEAAREAVEGVALGVDVHVTSAETGAGVEELAVYAEGHRTVALIGPSGVGKSTLINALVGSEVQATREVRVSDGKGRHTTVARELVPLPNGGVLVDTPGLRAVALTDAEEGIAATFPEIVELAERCRFRDCSHEREPGCAVLAAVESGELAEERLASYQKLMNESRIAAIRGDARLWREEQRKWVQISKSVKQFYKESDKRGS